MSNMVEEKQKPKMGFKWEKNSAEIDSYYIQNIYYDTRNPASFSGIEKLYDYIEFNTAKNFKERY